MRIENGRRKSLPAKISWILPPDSCIPLQDLRFSSRLAQIAEQSLSLGNELKEGSISRRVGELCAALARPDPSQGIAAIGVNRQSFPLLAQPFSRPDDGKKFTYIIRAIKVGSDIKNRFPRLGMHTLILEPSGGAITGRINTNRWQKGL